jgi:hypothetical protein
MIIYYTVDGSFFIFAKANTHLYKNDGIDWVKRKGRDSVREDMVKLMHNGQHIITGRYTYSISLQVPRPCLTNQSF